MKRIFIERMCISKNRFKHVVTVSQSSHNILLLLTTARIHDLKETMKVQVSCGDRLLVVSVGHSYATPQKRIHRAGT